MLPDQVSTDKPSLISSKLHKPHCTLSNGNDKSAPIFQVKGFDIAAVPPPLIAWNPTLPNPSRSPTLKVHKEKILKEKRERIEISVSYFMFYFHRRNHTPRVPLHYTQLGLAWKTTQPHFPATKADPFTCPHLQLTNSTPTDWPGLYLLLLVQSYTHCYSILLSLDPPIYLLD